MYFCAKATNKRIKAMLKKWTRETVFEESKKYSSRAEFKKMKSGAFRIAYMNGWLSMVGKVK